MSFTVSSRHRAPGRHRAPRRRWPRRARVVAAVLGTVLAGSVAFAASNWIVGLNGGSNGQARSVTISNLTITATSSPSPANLLYPGATGDVVITIANPNPFPVTITGVSLPANTSYAAGYSDGALTTPQTGCLAATPSGVTWRFATGTTSSHTLTSAVTVAASGAPDNPLTVTLTGAATMSSTAPSACAGSYFSMPSFAGVTATGGAATATTSPATAAWTS
jgi:hypothetical protein